MPSSRWGWQADRLLEHRPRRPRILPHDEQTSRGLQPVITLPGKSVAGPNQDCGEPWGFKACQAAFSPLVSNYHRARS